MIRGTGKKTAEAVGVHPSTVSRKIAKQDEQITREALKMQQEIKTDQTLNQLNKQ